MNHYHVTTYTGQKLAEYESHASKQDTMVMEFLAHNREIGFTAEDIHEDILFHAPLTSTRRALSNLYARGRVSKVGEAEGSYGRPITVWQYRGMK